MYTLLDTCLDRLDIFEFLSHVEDGLKDHYDIKVREISWLYCLILDFCRVRVFSMKHLHEDNSFYAPCWQGPFGRAPPFFVIIRSSSRSRLSLPCRRRSFFFFYRPREKTRDFFLRPKNPAPATQARLSSRNAPPLSVAWRHKYPLCSRLDFRTLAFQNTLGLVIAWVILIYFHKDVAVWG